MELEQFEEKLPHIATAGWTLMKKLCIVLSDFAEATEALSSRSASIAEVCT
jgi:hypothetical protein